MNTVTIPTPSGPLPTINKGLLQARHIQAKLKEHVADPSLPRSGEFWSPMTSGPYMVPVIRWFD
jgi:hypothetical protein